MKNLSYVLLVILLVSFSRQAFAGDVKSIKSGNWTNDSTWSTNKVPTATDNVYIQHAVTFDDTVGATINDLIVGSDTSTAGGWRTLATKSTKLTVNGNITIYPNNYFKVQSSTVAVALGHQLLIQGNLVNNGSSFDLKTGSSTGPTWAVCQITFFGSNNSEVTMNGAYSSTNNEFAGITVNKTGGAKVILHSDVVVAGGDSKVPASVNPITSLVEGSVETGQYTLISQGTGTTYIDTASANKGYISGNLARGMTNSSTTGTRVFFPVGDVTGYHPIYVKSSTSGVATGHYLRVSCVSGNANTGSSTFDGLIDKVSEVRYYKVTYSKTVLGTSAPDTMGVDHFRPSYELADGVAAGNTDLRVAYSTDDRKSWVMLKNITPSTTAPSNIPVFYIPDTLASPGIVLRNGVNSVCIALARAIGTTTNSLAATTDVRLENAKVKTFMVEQNYPNPFNPSTTINYNIPENSYVTLKVYNMLGKEVSVLANEFKAAGYYQAKFNSNNLPSGIYFYTLNVGKFSETRKMILMK